MDGLTLFLGVVLAGLSATLAAIGATSAARYRDGRLALVASGLGLLGVVGGLAAVHELSPRYGSILDVDPVPLGLLVLAVLLIYFALVRGAPRAPPG